MAKPAEKTDQQAAREVLHELEQSGKATLSWSEAMAFIRRLPKTMSPGGTSADDIRELRGPLPDDDPDFVNVDRR